MSNQVFPTLAGLGWTVVKRPIWRTLIQETVSGKELRLAQMSYPLWRFVLQYDVLREAAAYAELQTLMGFFNARFGSFDTWLFTDPSDNAVTLHSFGLGTGSVTAFPLTRTYGGFIEPIQNVNGTASIYKDGVLQTLTTHYTINSLGIVTFVTPPGLGAALAWTGSFYYRCRFAQDQADFENFMYQLWNLKKLEFQSVKL